MIVALGTGMRLGEQLRMKRSQVDFLRSIVTARKTKNGRPRDIPMNDEVRETLAELCKDKRSDDNVFVSPFRISVSVGNHTRGGLEFSMTVR